MDLQIFSNNQHSVYECPNGGLLSNSPKRRKMAQQYKIQLTTASSDFDQDVERGFSASHSKIKQYANDKILNALSQYYDLKKREVIKKNWAFDHSLLNSQIDKILKRHLPKIAEDNQINFGTFQKYVGSLNYILRNPAVQAVFQSLYDQSEKIQKLIESLDQSFKKKTFNFSEIAVFFLKSSPLDIKEYWRIYQIVRPIIPEVDRLVIDVEEFFTGKMTKHDQIKSITTFSDSYQELAKEGATHFQIATTQQPDRWIRSQNCDSEGDISKALKEYYIMWNQELKSFDRRTIAEINQAIKEKEREICIRSKIEFGAFNRYSEILKQFIYKPFYHTVFQSLYENVKEIKDLIAMNEPGYNQEYIKDPHEIAALCLNLKKEVAAEYYSVYKIARSIIDRVYSININLEPYFLCRQAKEINSSIEIKDLNSIFLAMEKYYSERKDDNFSNTLVDSRILSCYMKPFKEFLSNQLLYNVFDSLYARIEEIKDLIEKGDLEYQQNDIEAPHEIAALYLNWSYYKAQKYCRVYEIAKWIVTSEVESKVEIDSFFRKRQELKKLETVQIKLPAVLDSE